MKDKEESNEPKGDSYSSAKESDKSAEDSNDDNIDKEEKKKMWLFSLGPMADQLSHQSFQFLTFTYYYTVVGGISVSMIALAFTIFAVWDSINDPLFGPISDKTTSKHGRRGFWALVSIVPFSLLNLILFTVPEVSPLGKFFYMLFIIMFYDLFYTIFSTTQTALFPEMFDTEKKRARANIYKNILTIIGVLIGLVLPTIMINPLVPSEEVPRNVVKAKYIEYGGVLGILVFLLGFAFYKFGIEEKPPEIVKAEEMPKLWEQIKAALKNKTFLIMVTANLFIWFVFKMLTTLLPLYGVHVLGIKENDIMLSVLLLIAFLSATAFFPVMEKLGLKYGMRNGLIISQVVWIFTFIAFLFLDNNITGAAIGMFFMGIGLSGAMYYVDIIISQVIDEDELLSGYRRAGTFYGVNALINRYSTILVFVSIAGVLNGYGWDQYLIGADIEQVAALQKGLKLLFCGFTLIALVIVVFLMSKFPLHGAYWEDVQEKLRQKREREWQELFGKKNPDVDEENRKTIDR